MPIELVSSVPLPRHPNVVGTSGALSMMSLVRLVDGKSFSALVACNADIFGLRGDSYLSVSNIASAETTLHRLGFNQLRAERTFLFARLNLFGCPWSVRIARHGNYDEQAQNKPPDCDSEPNQRRFRRLFDHARNYHCNNRDADANHNGVLPAFALGDVHKQDDGEKGVTNVQQGFRNVAHTLIRNCGAQDYS